jgi:drug/metabolite transporter (DMT)-like permease
MLFMPIKNKKIFPLLVLIFLSMIWGSSFILIKKGLLSFTPIQVSALRIFFASIVLLPIAIKYIPEFKVHWKIIMILGFISNLLPAFLIAIAETKINSSLAGMLNSLTPITTMVIGALFFGTKFTFKLSIGLFIGLIGSLVLSFVSSNGELGSFNFYVLYVVAVTLLYGLSGNMVKDLVEKINPLILVPLELMAMLPLTIIILLSTNIFEQITTHDDALFSLAALFTLGAASTSIAGIIYIKLVKQTTAVFAAASTYLIPIMAITWGLFDNEVLFPLHFVGVGLIIVGVLLVNRFR